MYRAQYLCQNWETVQVTPVLWWPLLPPTLHSSGPPLATLSSARVWLLASPRLAPAPRTADTQWDTGNILLLVLLLVCLDFCVLCEVTITSLCSVSVQTRKNIFAGVGIIGNLHCVELLDTTHCHLLLERWEIISISLQSTHFLHGKTHYQYSIPIARIKANSHSTKHIVVGHSHTYKNVQFQGSLFASRSNNMYLWKSIIGSDIEQSSNKNIQIYSINEWKRGRVFMELVLSLCHCQWWEQRPNTPYIIYIMRVTAECCWYPTFQPPSLHNTNFGEILRWWFLIRVTKLKIWYVRGNWRIWTVPGFERQLKSGENTTYPTHEAGSLQAPGVIFVGAIK